MSKQNFPRIFSLFDQTTDCQIFGDTAVCQLDSLHNLVREWQASGATVVFKAGVFDLFHNNHLLFLTHLRMMGAAEHAAKQGRISPSDEELLEIAVSDQIRVILSLDSDTRADEAKSYISSKGYSPRPTLSWPNRAMMISHQQMTYHGRGKSLVDAIVMHGKDACAHADCPHADDSELALYLRPDIVYVNSENTEGLIRLTGTHCAIRSIKEADLAFHDPLLGGPIKTSNIINRAKRIPTS